MVRVAEELATTSIKGRHQLVEGLTCLFETPAPIVVLFCVSLADVEVREYRGHA